MLAITLSTLHTPLSLHDALPISWTSDVHSGSHAENLNITSYTNGDRKLLNAFNGTCSRSEEHTSELQSHSDLVCRLLLEKKNCVIEAIKLCSLYTVNMYIEARIN